MTLRSDNATAVAPEIMAALAEANQAAAVLPYGFDDISRRLGDRFAALFEREVAVFPVVTGTAANGLALAAMTPPWGAIYCHEGAHIALDECGGPEFQTGGAKLVPLPGAHGRLDPATLEAALKDAGVGDVHHVQPAAVSITDLTEAGTLYRPEQVAAIAGVARRHDLRLHMDGARFANAAAALGCSPADLTWRAGVDALSFGATKNGAMAAEAVVLFDPALAESLPFRRMRAGHLLSKSRYLAAQLETYIADGLWLRLAGHANAMAARLAARLGEMPGLSLDHPVEGNELFVRLPSARVAAVQKAGFAIRPWSEPDREAGPDAEIVVRLVAAWNTEPAEIDALAAALAGRAAA